MKHFNIEKYNDNTKYVNILHDLDFMETSVLAREINNIIKKKIIDNIIIDFSGTSYVCSIAIGMIINCAKYVNLVLVNIDKNKPLVDFFKTVGLDFKKVTYSLKVSIASSLEEVKNYLVKKSEVS